MKTKITLSVQEQVTLDYGDLLYSHWLVVAKIDNSPSTLCDFDFMAWEAPTVRHASMVGALIAMDREIERLMGKPDLDVDWRARLDACVLDINPKGTI